jgi:hypothetical protein
MKRRPNVVIPAEAGIHLSTAPGADEWVPAFAGMTAKFILPDWA